MGTTSFSNSGLKGIGTLAEATALVARAAARSAGNNFGMVEGSLPAAAFAGKTMLQRHRMVYTPLKDLLGGALDALALRTLAPGETS